MYFAFRPSGSGQPGAPVTSSGRGEWELAGVAPPWHARDLDGWHFEWELPILGRRPTGLHLAFGSRAKPTLRLIAGSGAAQVQQQMTGLLMLPPAVRQMFDASSAEPWIRTDSYTVTRVAFSSKQLTVPTPPNPGVAVVAPDTVFVAAGPAEAAIDVVNRLSRLKRLYASAARLDAGVARAVTDHQKAVGANGALGAAAVRATADVMVALEASPYSYIAATDPLPALEAALGFGPLITPDQVPGAEPEVKRRLTVELRLQRSRGHSGAQFRDAVMGAYKYRCLFCGQVLPPAGRGARPGVDAAHILPWGAYDLDVVQNGLSLCKLHHWAFDEQLLLLQRAANGYEVVVSERAKNAYVALPDTLRLLNNVAGSVDTGWLPARTDEWPSKAYLEHLYAEVPAED